MQEGVVRTVAEQHAAFRQAERGWIPMGPWSDAGRKPIAVNDVLDPELYWIPRATERAKEARIRHGASTKTGDTPLLCHDCPVRKCTI